MNWHDHGIHHYEDGFKQVEKLKRISPSELMIGDIVTRTNTTPQHIGIYTALNQVVEASIENEGVVISSLEKGNWTGGCRVKAEYL